MIVSYLSKVKGEIIETIVDGVSSIDNKGTEIVVYQKDKAITIYPKVHDQIYQMWLLNDEFKTLKKLI